MSRLFRSRRWHSVAVLVALAFMVSACSTEYPNSTFNHTTEFNTAIDALWTTQLLWGTIVFVGVEVGLLYVIFRFRRRPDSADPKPVHGNAMLEILWTAIPVVILLILAVPTVRTIFKTQAKAVPGALQVEVIGHQWWWEFKYPEYGITTANELYLPKGRTVNFALKTIDVLHSFWIPQLGGKRDLITNRTNYLWFTPNVDLETLALNGFCAEYCGTSHANMKFKVYTVEPDQFESWAQHQASVAVFPVAPPVAPPQPGGVPLVPASTASAPEQTAVAAVPSTGYSFPREDLPAHVIPTTRMPNSFTFDDSLLAAGDPERGRELYSRSSCIGCHAIKGNPMSMGILGPNLTHVATRHTIASGYFVNDARHLARWLKNAPAMKPGSKMPAIGIGQYDPTIKKEMSAAIGGLTDAQIADIVAYLQALK